MLVKLRQRFQYGPDRYMDMLLCQHQVNFLLWNSGKLLFNTTSYLVTSVQGHRKMLITDSGEVKGICRLNAKCALSFKWQYDKEIRQYIYIRCSEYIGQWRRIFFQWHHLPLDRWIIKAADNVFSWFTYIDRRPVVCDSRLFIFFSSLVLLNAFFIRTQKMVHTQ